MPTRQAACESCRLSKLACDHDRPTCGRCRQRGQADSCKYRARPFKKNRSTLLAESPSLSHTDHRPEQAINSLQATNSSSRPRQYPNPGYLGPSSHVTIFEQFPPGLDEPQSGLTVRSPLNHDHPHPPSIREQQIVRGQRLIERIVEAANVPSHARLVGYWLDRGTNLALAGPFVTLCNGMTQGLFKGLEDTRDTYIRSKELFQHSCSPLTVNETTTFDGFCDTFCRGVATWEGLGIFFTAASKAAGDIRSFPDLYISQDQRRNLQESAMHFADECLDISLSLDCLNDVQLVLQYENFINHTYTNGDESLQSWRRMGDVISSIYALGYHDQARTRRSCPKFLIAIREATFAFTYSADKNMSIFLGRPPRMLRQHCNFDFLKDMQQDMLPNNTVGREYFGWNIDDHFGYMTEAWWSMVCATHKEDTLDLYRESNHHRRTQTASEIKARAERSWSNLPKRFQLVGDLMSASHYPVERDFVASARLNYLHIHFLLELSLSKRLIDPDATLLSIAYEMFGLVMEAAILKEHLVDSGTGIQWKIAYYGLPAAGILCLSLLNHSTSLEEASISMPKIIQDLGVFVALMESNGLINTMDSNYALLSEAARTVKVILNQTLQKTVEQCGTTRQQATSQVTSSAVYTWDDWVPWTEVNNWDFEVDFWTNLAEHPSLLPAEMHER